MPLMGTSGFGTGSVFLALRFRLRRIDLGPGDRRGDEYLPQIFHLYALPLLPCKQGHEYSHTHTAGKILACRGCSAYLGCMLLYAMAEGGGLEADMLKL